MPIVRCVMQMTGRGGAINTSAMVTMSRSKGTREAIESQNKPMLAFTFIEHGIEG
jgi:hypothetical protein